MLGAPLDFNDLAVRLERLYTAIGHKADGEIQKYFKISIIGDLNDPTHKLVISFTRDQNKSETTNIAFVIIEHLAKLKDHLKNEMGDRKQLVEDHINQSLELQLIMDLSNAEKHGYPLSRPERSQRSPRLQDIGADLTIPPQGELLIDIGTEIVVEPGNCQIRVQADVLDKSGALICQWSAMIDKALAEWEAFIREHDLKQNSQ